MSDELFNRADVASSIDRLLDAAFTEEVMLSETQQLPMAEAFSLVQGILAAVVARRFAELPVDRDRILAGIATFNAHLTRFTLEQWEREQPK